MNRKTLIILTPGFPANEADCNCVNFPQTFTKNLKRLNPRLDIIVFAFQYPYSIQEYEWHGVKVFPFNGNNKGKLHRLLLWKKIWQKLKTEIASHDVCGILSLWLGESALLGKYAAKKYGLKHFTWMLGQDARPGNRYLKLVNPSPESLVALSDSIADECFKNYNIKPVHIIPPGIARQQFGEMPAKRRIDIMGAGSLISLKQYDIFIKIVEQLSKKHPTIKTVISGDGDQRSFLQKMIDEKNLAANIKLTGDISHEEVLAYMQTSKVFLHPSSYEGFSTACNEALYAGAHVVSFCEPMQHKIDHLHVVKNEKEMLSVVEKILQTEPLPHDRVLTYPIDEICKRMLLLFSA